MYHLWLNQDVSNIKLTTFKSYVKQCFKDLFLQEQYSHIDNDSIYTNYRIFKSSFQQEPFIRLLPKDCITSLVKFRCTNNKLPVNTLRFSGAPRQDRLCQLCDMNELGDEFHYLFICPFLQDKRKDLLPLYYHKNPNVIKYKCLFNTSDKCLLLKLKHFICYINQVFRL